MSYECRSEGLIAECISSFFFFLGVLVVGWGKNTNIYRIWMKNRLNVCWHFIFIQWTSCAVTDMSVSFEISFFIFYFFAVFSTYIKFSKGKRCSNTNIWLPCKLMSLGKSILLLVQVWGLRPSGLNFNEYCWAGKCLITRASLWRFFDCISASSITGYWLKLFVHEVKWRK